MKSPPKTSIREILDKAHKNAAQNHYDKAIQLCHEILTLVPSHLEALRLLASCYQRSEDFQNAKLYLNKAISVSPHDSNLWLSLGRLQASNNQSDAAFEAYQQAQAIEPFNPYAHLGLAKIWLLKKEFNKAMASLYRAHRFHPNDPDILYSLGITQLTHGQLKEAIASLTRVLKLAPKHFEALKSLGRAYIRDQNLEAATQHYTTAIECYPESAQFRHKLGKCYTKLNLPVQALQHYKYAYKTGPSNSELENDLAVAFHDVGEPQNAFKLFNIIVKSNPTAITPHNNRVLSAHYCHDISNEELFCMHIEAAEALEKSTPTPWSHPKIRLAKGQKIKLGFVSPDVHAHPVGFFLLPLLKNMDPEQFEIYMYHDARKSDWLTEKIKSDTYAYVDTNHWSNRRLAEQIYKEQIHILIDCAGHTAKNRLKLFAQKPAPIQLTGFGYVNTSGLKAMDYLLTDHHQSPIGQEKLYREKLARLPNDYICYQPPEYIPDVSDLPALQSQTITLGCFNRLAKLTPQTLKLWARVLEALPNARLSLKASGLEHPALANHLLANLKTAGIHPDRVNLSGKASHQDFLAAYQEIDIGLDPLPYSGGLTTCEALWMGIPVVTIRGDRFASLHSTSHLINANLEDWVQPDEDGYINHLVGWAGRLDELQALRQTMRERLRQSPLSDGAKYAKDFSNLLLNCFREHSN